MKKRYQQPATELLEMEHKEDFLRGSTWEVFAKSFGGFDDDEIAVTVKTPIEEDEDFFDDEDIESLPIFNVWEK